MGQMLDAVQYADKWQRGCICGRECIAYTAGRHSASSSLCCQNELTNVRFPRYVIRYCVDGGGGR